MPKVVLSKKAKKDLGGILAYTQKQWGANQRTKYHDQLENRLKDLADTPGKGKKSPHVNETLFYYYEGRHAIFYRKIADGIEVVRILHEKMDFKRHL